LLRFLTALHISVEEKSMIARIWSGWVPAHKADEYYSYLLRTGVADYRATPGNRGVQLLRRTRGDATQFLFLTLWDSWDAIRLFAGDPPDQAHYYPEDTEFLLELTPTVEHYELVMLPEDSASASSGSVRELRVALTVERFEQALAFYHDGLNLPLEQSWVAPTGRGAVLQAGRATLELIDAAQAELIDQVEVGARVAGPVRLAFQVPAVQAATDAAQAAGAQLLHAPVETPWRHRNARLMAPDGMQLTFFELLDDHVGV
jgi:heme-degrading monooxygenase HmoA/catechol 2,3-dioxygenase-like lactoylglutathione lyase family enzyme